MVIKKFNLGILLLSVLVFIVLIPSVVNPQTENNYNVTVEEAFEHAHAHMLFFISTGVEFESWQGAFIDPKPLELYDINGQKLYYEFSIYKDGKLIGKIYVAANKELGPAIQLFEPNPPQFNSTEAIRKSIEVAKNEYSSGEIKSTAMVVYSYPRIGAMTTVKNTTTGDEHRIFIDVYTLEVVPDKPASLTELGVYSLYEQKLKNGVEGNLKMWQESEAFTKSIELEADSKGIDINTSNTSDDFLSSELNNVHHSYYTYFFGLNSYGNTVIKQYGKPPILKTEEQKKNWDLKLEGLGNKIKNTVASKYMYPHGKVMTCGTNAKGYFVILFKNSDIDESLISEMYSLIDNSAKDVGIPDIPVEFAYGIYREESVLDSEKGVYHWLGESKDNLSKSYMHDIEEHMKRKPKQLRSGNITTFGRAPLLKDQEDFEKWKNKRISVVDSTFGEITPYMEKGQVLGYGIGFTSIEVELNENLPPEEKNALSEEIYQIIDNGAKKQNVTDVLVVFEDGGEVKDDTAVDETTDLSESEENPEQSNHSINNGSNAGNSSKKNNFAPGLGLLSGLVCLFMGWYLRKK